MNISLPLELSKTIEATVKEKHFASKSEFFRYLIREWMAGRLAHDFEHGRQEHLSGKTKILKSVGDLWT